MREIGVLGGSFNPIHVGHLIVASYIQQHAGLDEVWLSLSPANPLKHGREEASDTDRLAMMQMAVVAGHGLRVTDKELALPRPSYTIEFLRYLAAEYPDCRFRLIIGSDNWLIFDRWRESEAILDGFGVIVYPRPGYPIEATDDERALLVDAPGIDISSTMIREGVSSGRDMNFFLPAGVYRYIQENKLYL